MASISIVRDSDGRQTVVERSIVRVALLSKQRVPIARAFLEQVAEALCPCTEGETLCGCVVQEWIERPIYFGVLPLVALKDERW